MEAVPPGQQPSNIKPTEREGESPKILLIANAEAGIIVYWAKQPNNIWTKGQSNKLRNWKIIFKNRHQASASLKSWHSLRNQWKPSIRIYEHLKKI